MVGVDVSVVVGVVISHPAKPPYKKASVISLITLAASSHVASGMVKTFPKQPIVTSGGAR